jgi:hypothetical protein
MQMPAADGVGVGGDWGRLVQAEVVVEAVVM